MEFRTQFTERHVKKGLVFEKPSVTKQAPKDECDVNKIMAKYNLTGQIDHVRAMQPVYGDATLFGDYREMLEKVRRADDAFMTLPSELRAELGHNPGNLVKYIQNPANKDKLIKYGVLKDDKVVAQNRIVNNVVSSPDAGSVNNPSNTPESS